MERTCDGCQFAGTLSKPPEHKCGQSTPIHFKRAMANEESPPLDRTDHCIYRVGALIRSSQKKNKDMGRRSNEEVR